MGGGVTGGSPTSHAPSMIRQNCGCQCSNRAGWDCQRWNQYSKEERSVSISPSLR